MLVAFGAAVILIIAAVFLNYQSPQVVNAAAPVAVGVLAALSLVFVFNAPEPIRRVFPVTFFLQRADKYPISIPYRPFPPMSLALFDSAQRANPEAFNFPAGQDTSLDALLYHEFLQKLIVDWIASRHFGTWRMETDLFELGLGAQEQFRPMADASNYRSTVLTSEELAQRLEGNRFAPVHSGFGRLAVPEGMTLTVRPAQADFLQPGEIQFRDRYCELTITTTYSMGGVGLGSYTMLLGLTLQDAQDRYWSEHYIVRINATFNRFLMGHPNMAAHRDWAEGIIDGLARAFDEESLWRRTLDGYMLRQHILQQYPTPPLGPIRSAP
jgi:hypothetical protein